MLGTLSPAHADPAGFKLLNGVGSDTTANVLSGLALSISSIGSYDATGSATIQTTATGPAFTRPSGTYGQAALSFTIDPTGNGGMYGWPGGANLVGQVDFARSLLMPSGSFPGTQLTFVPFALDKVTFAIHAASDFPRDIPIGSASQDSMSPAIFSLRNIYRGAVTTYTNKSFDVVQIRPLLPASGSDLREFWLKQLGLTEASIVGMATDLAGSVVDNDGTFVTQEGDIVPFSVGQYIAQSTHDSLPSVVDEHRGYTELGSIGSIRPYLPTPNGGIMPNPSFPVGTLVFNVVSSSRLSGTSSADLALRAAFAGPSSQVCAAAATIKTYGFATIGNLCGNTASYKQGLRF